jgi:geranylgeranyl reductase family protein
MLTRRFVMDTDAVTIWDAIIVGAGPSGCAAAYDLAGDGHSVLLLDKAEFPRPKACAGGLTRKTLQALRYSVTPVIRAERDAITIEKNPAERMPVRSRTPVCAMTVRQELDDFCLRQAMAAGARFERIVPITGVSESADEVCVHAGAKTFRGRFLVGADGVHSQVRQFAGSAKWFRRGFALEANVRIGNAASAEVVFDLNPVRGGYGWVFPKGDHVNVGLYCIDNSEKLNRERLTTYIGSRYGPVPAEQFIGQYLGFGAEHAEPSSSRIFLVGDAGGFADPLTGEGIYGAVVSGQAAAWAIARHLRGRAAAAQAFAKATSRLRADLRISAAGARWFYANPSAGYRAFAVPLLRRVILRAYADGRGVAAVAGAVKRFEGTFRGRSGS